MASAATAESRFVPSIGFVVAGFALATGFLEWTPAVALGPVESVPGVIAALVTLVAFGVRRYGAGDRRWSVVAAVGAAGIALAAAAALIYPVASGMGDQPIGVGINLAFVLGVLDVGVAYADWVGLSRPAFLERSRYGLSALGIGLVGLLGGMLFSLFGVSLVAEQTGLVQRGVGTASFSVGLGVVAVVFLLSTGNDLSYLDVKWPSRRDWLYVIGGIVAMYVILLSLGLLSGSLGIPSAQHGLIEDAKANPELLLAFIPLSWLAIGPGEELLSRNIVQKYLYDAYSRPAAVLVATLVFTIIHLPAYATAGPAAVFSTLVRLFAISLVLGVVYERTRSVVVSALVHGTYDAIQFGLAYVAITSGYI